MSKIGKKIPCRSCLTEAILVIGEKIVRFKMFDEVGIKQSFENLGNSRSESNRAIVGGVRAVTLLKPYKGFNYPASLILCCEKKIPCILCAMENVPFY